VSGWCLLRQHQALGGSEDAAQADAKRVTMRFFLDHIVPEATGLKASATAGATLLYELESVALAG